MSAQFPKACRVCGRSHSSEGWAELQLKGVQPDPEEPLELRNCACGSTLAIVLPVVPA